MGEYSKAIVSITTRDGRLVYLSGVAKPPQPGLDEALSSVLASLSSHSYRELNGDRVVLEARKMLESQGFKVESLEIYVSHRCPMCGASINITPETVIYVCPYCGWTGDVYGHSLAFKVWPAPPREAVEEAARRLGGVLDNATLYYVPFWVFRVNVTGEYSGTAVYTVQRAERVPVRRNRETEWVTVVRTETRTKKVAGKIRFEAVKGAFGRLYAEIFGAGELKSWVEHSWQTNPPKEMEASELKKYAENFLSAEVSDEEAFGLLRKEIDTEIYRAIETSAARQVEGSLTEVQVEYLSTQVNTPEKHLVYVPYWFFTYKVRGNLYAGSLVGPTATVIRAERYISNVERVAKIISAWVAVLVTGAFTEFALRYGVGWVFLAAPLGLLGAYKLASSAFEAAEVV